MLNDQSFPKGYLKEPIDCHTYEEYCTPRLCMGKPVISKEVFNILHGTQAILMLARINKQENTQ